MIKNSTLSKKKKNVEGHNNGYQWNRKWIKIEKIHEMKDGSLKRLIKLIYHS